MQWSKKKDGKNSPREISGTAFLPTLYSLLGWNDDCRYRITGVKRGSGNDAVLLFNLSEPEIFIPNDMVGAPDADPAVKPFTDNQQRNVRAYPPDWADTFGAIITATHRQRNLPDSADIKTRIPPMPR